MVAFGMSSPPAVLDLDGSKLRELFETDPGWFVENVEDQFSEMELQGIQVWEGEPDTEVQDDDAADGEYFKPTALLSGAWRAPTDAEWVALRACRSPFNSSAEDLRSLVE